VSFLFAYLLLWWLCFRVYRLLDPVKILSWLDTIYNSCKENKNRRTSRSCMAYASCMHMMVAWISFLRAEGLLLYIGGDEEGFQRHRCPGTRNKGNENVRWVQEFFQVHFFPVYGDLFLARFLVLLKLWERNVEPSTSVHLWQVADRQSLVHRSSIVAVLNIFILAFFSTASARGQHFHWRLFWNRQWKVHFHWRFS
jgi:hypothetical protein